MAAIVDLISQRSDSGDPMLGVDIPYGPTCHSLSDQFGYAANPRASLEGVAWNPCVARCVSVFQYFGDPQRFSLSENCRKLSFSNTEPLVNDLVFYLPTCFVISGVSYSEPVFLLLSLDLVCFDLFCIDDERAVPPSGC